jgi:hypothetical protein
MILFYISFVPAFDIYTAQVQLASSAINCLGRAGRGVGHGAVRCMGVPDGVQLIRPSLPPEAEPVNKREQLSVCTDMHDHRKVGARHACGQSL